MYTIQIYISEEYHMKKIVNAIRSHFNRMRRKGSAALHIVSGRIRYACALVAMPRVTRSAHCAVAQNRAEGFVDTALKILMAVVIGALIMAGLYALFGDTILPTLTRSISELFNYAG